MQEHGGLSRQTSFALTLIFSLALALVLGKRLKYTPLLEVLKPRPCY